MPNAGIKRPNDVILNKGATLKLISENAALLQSVGVVSAEAEMETILCYLLDLDRLQLYLHGDEMLNENIVNRLNEIVAKRKTRYPLQFILNESWFFGRKFYVDESVMIPTPETELVCQTAISFLNSEDTPTVLDIGAGSGVIAVTLATEVNSCTVVATDISVDALKTAERNAIAHYVNEKIKFRQSNLFENIESGEKFNLIISNPPYISEDDFPSLAPEVKADPKIALTSGKDGLDIIRVILDKAPNHLGANGRIMLEIGYNQSEAISKIFESDNRYKSFNILQDLNGIDRTVILSCTD